MGRDDDKFRTGRSRADLTLAVRALTENVGPLAGPAHYGLQNLVAFSWAGPLWSAISCGPLVGPAHLNFMGHFWAHPSVNIP